ncbi:MAG TPA: class I SAM-dependent methyltransferase [Terriglobales bacterium]|jgi:demethylmenaquinone methyltransferase/2-methoxy-6-polyprenyl-1,4-benzoquinol methylase|nr:class I SAM-dependent methyltransferase [Terriglobales bacterium]
MRRGRRAYYDSFSRFYDRFVALHSRDRPGLARKFLVDRVPVPNGGSVLDLCTGTATLLTWLQAKVGADGRVVGVDFSHGMLKAAQEKTKSFANVYLVEADAGCLPFVTGAFDAVTCSHAFYELKGEAQDRALQEIVRVLRPQGTFLMMEHDVPVNPFVRALFYLRIAFMGAGRAITFLRHEQDVLARYFGSVAKFVAPAGRSKVMVCQK